MALIPIDEALALLMDGVKPLPTEAVPVADAVGRFLSDAVSSPVAFPFESNSAMDGYALRAEAGPWRVIGESAAGKPFGGRLEGNEAVRIFTGAVVPDGADTVLMQENAERDGEALIATQGPELGRHIRHAGSDITVGQPLLDAGQRLRPLDTGAMAGLGFSTLPCHRRPRVIVFSTGDELRPAGAQLESGQIYESNGVQLAATATAAGAEVIARYHLPDQRAVIDEALVDAVQRADVVLLSGGVSVGDHDHVGAALAALCGGLEFHKVRMKPGKPVAAGRSGNCTLIGLPGNPASAAVAFELFARPVLRTLLGDKRPHRRVLVRKAGADLKASGARAEFLRGRWSGGQITATTRQGSGDLSSLTGVNAFIVRPPNSDPVQAGDEVFCMPLFGRGDANPPEAQWAALES